MKAYDKSQRTAGKDRPFFARLLEESKEAKQGQEAPRTTRKAGKGGNDVDQDGDSFEQSPPRMTTMKAGKCGNDCDRDSDVG